MSVERITALGHKGGGSAAVRAAPTEGAVSNNVGVLQST